MLLHSPLIISFNQFPMRANKTDPRNFILIHSILPQIESVVNTYACYDKTDKSVVELSVKVWKFEDQSCWPTLEID